MTTPLTRAAAWRVVVGFGLVSLAVDMVSDGARSIAGPLLGELGATALIVGLVTGISEALGFVLRLYTGPRVDRSRRYWGFTMGGYALTAVCVPLLALTPFLGSMALAAASMLIVVERVGKAVRSPAKTVLLAHAAGVVGRGQGFAVHKMLDQVGAFSGPILVAAVIGATGALWPAFVVLVIPGIAALWLLLVLKRRVPAPDGLDAPDGVDSAPRGRLANSRAAQRFPVAAALPASFYLFATSTALTTLGLVGFGVMSFHMAESGMVSLAAIPLVFALGMIAAAVAALVSGRVYDRVGSVVFLAVPVIVLGVPGLSLSDNLIAALVGVSLWGFATGIQDSTVKAFVADLVSVHHRGLAYGIFATFQGTGTLVGAVLAGALYGHLPTLLTIAIPAQVAAFAVMAFAVSRARRVERP